MTSNKNIISMCYDYIKSNPKISNSEFDLTEILNSLKLSKEEMDKIKKRVGILYIELLQDSRFIYVNGKWALKENYTYAEYNKKINELYNYDSSIYETDDEIKKTPTTIFNDDIIDEEPSDIIPEPSFYSSDDDIDIHFDNLKETLDIEIEDDKDLDI